MFKTIKRWFLKDQRRLVALGTLLEYYDFFLFVHLGTLLSKSFFRPDAPQLWFDYIKWGGIYIITPLSALLFAHFGDRVGRKPVLIYSSVFVVLSASLMIFLPTYDAWETMSTVCFILLRFVQNAGIAGEPLAAKLYACEHMQAKDHDLLGDMYTNKTSWWLNVIGMCQDASSLMALGLGWCIVTYFPDHPYMWRMPFVFCLLGAIFVVMVRKTLLETKEFVAFPRKKYDLPELWDEIKNNRHFVIFTILCTYVGIIFAFNIMYLSKHILEKLNCYTDAELMKHNACILFLNIIIGSVITWFAGHRRWKRKGIQLGIYVASAISWVIFYNMQITAENYYYLIILQSCGQSFLYWNLIYGNVLRNFSIEGRFRLCALGELLGRFTSFVAIGFFLPFLYNDLGVHYGLYMTLFMLCYAFITVLFYQPEEEARQRYLKKLMDKVIVKNDK